MKMLKLSLKNLYGNRSNNVGFLLFQIVIFTALVISGVLVDNLDGQLRDTVTNSDDVRTVELMWANPVTESTEVDRIVSEILTLENVEKVIKTENGLNIVVNSTENINTVKFTISDKYMMDEMSTMSKKDYAQDFDFIAKIIKIIVIILIIMIMLIFSLNIYKSVLDRAKEYAIYKAIGYKPFHIYQIVLFENAVRVIISLLVSIGVSVICIKLLVQKIFSIVLEVEYIRLQISADLVLKLIPIVLIIIIICSQASNRAYSRVSTAKLFNEE